MFVLDCSLWLWLGSDHDSGFKILLAKIQPFRILHSLEFLLITTAYLDLRPTNQLSLTQNIDLKEKPSSDFFLTLQGRERISQDNISAAEAEMHPNIAWCNDPFLGNRIPMADVPPHQVK